MASLPNTPYPEAEPIQFELDSFELTDDDRLELSGRWFGIRGRRFIRPTLTLHSERGKSRSLADLEHKPWSAEDGETWHAAFPCEFDGSELTEVELAVAPDIAVSLPPPTSPGERARAAGDRIGANPRPIGESRRGAKSAGAETATVSKLESTIGERDQALSARDAAIRERDHALSARDVAMRERDQALSARDEAIERRDHALHGRAAALARLDEARAAARAQLAGMREQIEREQIEREQAERGQAEREQADVRRLAEPRAMPLIHSSPAPITGRTARPTRRGAADWLRRVLAVLVLLAVVIAVAIVLRSA